MNHCVLVLEDQEEIREFIVINLRRAGYDVLEAGTGEDALKIISTEKKIDIAVLDIMLPGAIDGLDVCKKIREIDQIMGVIMLTAKAQVLDKVNGLSFGADDYVVKPFSPTELVARVDALCRRVDLLKRRRVEEMGAGPFRLDVKGRNFFKNDVEIELTQVEFSIIELFLKNQNKSLSRDFILDNVWGENFVGSIKIVDVNIRRIRQKIEDDPSNPKYIETIWGYGYRWREED